MSLGNGNVDRIAVYRRPGETSWTRLPGPPIIGPISLFSEQQAGFRMLPVTKRDGSTVIALTFMESPDAERGTILAEYPGLDLYGAEIKLTDPLHCQLQQPAPKPKEVEVHFERDANGQIIKMTERPR